MDRHISPPPLKRRKLSTPKVEPILPEPREYEDPLIIRVYSWNINGIAPFLQKTLSSFFTSPSKTTSAAAVTAPLRQFLRRHKWPHILCLQEIKIAPSDTQSQSALLRAVNNSIGDGGPPYEIFMTLPNDKFNARGLGGKGRVYGVCTIIRRDFYAKHVTAVRTVDWDSEGRFSIVEVDGGILSIWNVYAVNGTSNAYRDSRSGEVVGTRHDRKLAVHRLMMEECLKIEKGGGEVLIIGDLNVAPRRIDGHPNLRTFPEQHIINRANFNNKFLNEQNMQGLRGVDVWRCLRGEERKYTYHPRNGTWGRSCDRVDLAIVSRSMLKDGRLVEAEIWDSEMERGPSDHVPISVDLKVRKVEEVVK